MITGRRAYPKWFVRGLIVFAIGMTAFAAVASREHNSADSARDAALSLYVSLESRTMRSNDPALAVQLALVAYRLSANAETRSTLLDATATATATPGTGPATVASSVNPHAGDQALHRTQAQTSVTSSALSADGQLFAAGSSRGSVWLWDISDPASPQLLAKLSGFSGTISSVLFSGNSKTLFAGSADHSVRIWSVAKPLQPTLLKGSPLLGPSSAVTRMALSSDGTTLAVATADGDVWEWDVANPANASLNATLTAATGDLTTLAFSSDDSTLAAGAGKHPLIYWHYRPPEAEALLCSQANSAITTSQWKLYVPGAPFKRPCTKRTSA